MAFITPPVQLHVLLQVWITWLLWLSTILIQTIPQEVMFQIWWSVFLRVWLNLSTTTINVFRMTWMILLILRNTEDTILLSHLDFID